MKFILKYFVGSLLVLLLLQNLVHCKKHTYIKYPITVNFFVDSLEDFGQYAPELGPNLIFSVKNIGFENVVMNGLQSNDLQSYFVPTFNKTVYFEGNLTDSVRISTISRISEYWGLVHKADTILPNQEKKYLFELNHSDVIQHSVSYILVEIPIKSPYFDSLNINNPFVLNRLYPNVYKKNMSETYANKELKHPFFVFSTQDSVSLVNVTNEFIKKGIVKQK